MRVRSSYSGVFRVFFFHHFFLVLPTVGCPSVLNRLGGQEKTYNNNQKIALTLTARSHLVVSIKRTLMSETKTIARPPRNEVALHQTFPPRSPPQPPLFVYINRDTPSRGRVSQPGSPRRRVRFEHPFLGRVLLPRMQKAAKSVSGNVPRLAEYIGKLQLFAGVENIQISVFPKFYLLFIASNRNAVSLRRKTINSTLMTNEILPLCITSTTTAGDCVLLSTTCMLT